MESFKSLIREDYLSVSINGLKIVNMFPEELKMILDDYSFIFNNYVDARNKILNNEVEFDFDFMSIPFTKEQKLEEGIQREPRNRLPNRITSNRFKLEKLGITSIVCESCLQCLELINFTICNNCYTSKCRKCRCNSIDREKKREYEREWHKKNKK
jgi:hypothetical protein